MQQLVRDYRSALLFRGILAVIFGVLVLAWPRLSLVVLVLVFGIYAVVGGIVAVVDALRRTHEQSWGLLLVEGILSIIVGVVALVWPAITAFAFLFLIAAWAIVVGVMEIVGAFTLPLGTGRQWLLGLAGLASIIFGVLIATWPRAGLLTVIWLIGIYAIVFGILSIARYFQSRALASIPA